MKRLIFLFVLFIVTGCACSNSLAKDAVSEYLNNYTNLSENVLIEIDELLEDEDLTQEEKDKYKEVLKRQYSNLFYTIENETYNGDTADVTVKISVFDLHKADSMAYLYLQSHPEEFLTDGEYDVLKYRDYKLDMMKSIEDVISYNIVFHVEKKNNEWFVLQPDGEVLEKIHGIYNYEK